MTYQEFRSYSPYHDTDMVRVSMTDERGAEYFKLIRAEYGKSYREARNRALDAIETAMRLGLEPGEVRTD